jgi:hypothetical protein
VAQRLVKPDAYVDGAQDIYLSHCANIAGIVETVVESRCPCGRCNVSSDPQFRADVAAAVAAYVAATGAEVEDAPDDATNDSLADDDVDS